MNIPALAPDARTQTGRGGTRRVSLVGFKETVANVTNSLVITPQHCGKIIVLQRFNLMSRPSGARPTLRTAFSGAVRILGSF